MTHYLEDFTELLPSKPSLEATKAKMLATADELGIDAYLRVRGIKEHLIERKVKYELDEMMSSLIGQIVEERGLLNEDELDFLDIRHEDPSAEFVAAVTDAVKVSFIYEIAREEFKDEEQRFGATNTTSSKLKDVQHFVEEIATSLPSLGGTENMHALDEMISELHSSAPWMSDLSDWAYKTLRAQYRAGETWMSLPPVILIGPPGCGKSTYARKLAKLAGLPSRKLDAAASNASFTIVGSDSTWASAQAGVPLQEIAKTGIANPIMIIDEIEKAGTARTSSGTKVSLPDALLGLLEPVSSTTWECPYTRRRFNMSKITWMMTANEKQGIPEPLFDRCRVFNIGYPEGKELIHLIRKQSEGRIFDEVVERLIQRVSLSESKGRPMSLRRIQQLIDQAAAVSANPVLH